MTIPEFVKEKRASAKLTQLDLSEKAGVGLRFIRELELYQQNFSQRKRLCKVNSYKGKAYLSAK